MQWHIDGLLNGFLATLVLSVLSQYNHAKGYNNKQYVFIIPW